MGRYIAVKPGKLPPAENAVVGATRLPQGETIANALWVSKAVVKKIGKPWRELVRVHATTGLWPLVLTSLGRGKDDLRPWLAGELEPPETPELDHDPIAVIAKRWVLKTADAAPDVAFTGLAPKTNEGFEPIHDQVDALAGRLGVAVIARPADAPEVLGWGGALNHISDPADVSAVLRSWEERFGAYVIGMGFATITLGVERPVTSHAHADAVAREHLAFCPDVIFQGPGFPRYAYDLVGAVRWQLWWD